MRILYFTRDYTTHDRGFLQKLVASSHEIHFLRLEDDGVLYEQRPLPDGVRTVEWKGGVAPARSLADWMALMPDVERVLAEIRPDLVHAGPIQSCGFLTALAGFRPLMLMSWGSDLLVDADRDAAHQWITRYALRHSDYLLCDCDTVRQRTQAFHPYASDRIVQFPWGVDLARFSPADDSTAARRRLGLNGELIILSTRLWEEIYDIETVLEAVRLARNQRPDLRLILLGDGSRAPWVRKYIAEQGLAESVMTPGLVPHSELPDYFRAADLYLSCARSDGSSISLLEAMATALPVVVTDTPANREWIGPDQGGALAPTGDAGAFARAILSLSLLDMQGRRALGARNRQVAISRADWDANIARLLRTYEQIHARYAGARETGFALT